MQKSRYGSGDELGREDTSIGKAYGAAGGWGRNGGHDDSHAQWIFVVEFVGLARN